MSQEISLNITQIINSFRQLSYKQKLRVAKEIEKETLESKLSKLLSAFKTDELSEKDINEAVEEVRNEMNDESKNK